MEIERKWMVTNWPDEKSFPLTETYQMDQGYISVRPASGAKHCRAAAPRWCFALRVRAL